MTIIKVDYAALERAREQIRTIQGMLDSNLEDLRKRLMGLNWDGSDREAYQAHQQQWDTAVTNLNNTLDRIGHEVDSAKARFHDNEKRGASRWGG